MLALPLDLTQKFQTLLGQAGVPINQRPYYHKWLRYYLDFCRKYHLEPSEKRHFPAFDEKLRSKNQSEMQRQQARQALALYYKSITSHQFPDPKPRIETVPNTNLQQRNAHLIQSALSVKEAQNISPNYAANQQDITANIKKSNTSIPRNENRSKKETDSNSLKLSNANWDWVYDCFNSAIKLRHYSPKTFQAYRIWIHKCQTFTKSKNARLEETVTITLAAPSLTYKYLIDHTLISEVIAFRQQIFSRVTRNKPGKMGVFLTALLTG